MLMALWEMISQKYSKQIKISIKTKSSVDLKLQVVEKVQKVVVQEKIVQEPKVQERKFLETVKKESQLILLKKEKKVV